MTDRSTRAVTGAYGYSGKYIAERLLQRGRRVITRTNSPHRRHTFGDRVPAVPFHFDHADTLGRRYSSELARRRDRLTAYSDVV